MSIQDRERRREYHRNWLAARREAYLTDKCCVDCGSKNNLEMDHVDPSLKISHSFWSWKQERREAEIAKCVVRCHECHVKKTWTLDRKRAEHGTHNKYTAGCRCTDCKNAHTLKMREWRKTKTQPIVFK